MYDGLPDPLRQHPEIRVRREHILHLLRNRTDRKAQQLCRAGDLIGALALYDGLPQELRAHAEIVRHRNEIVEQVCMRARTDARKLCDAGKIGAALDVFDTVPAHLRDHTRVVEGRDKVRSIVVKRAKNAVCELQHSEDLDALAVFQNLSSELREDPDMLQQYEHGASELPWRNEVQARQLWCAGKVSAALAVFDDLPEPLRNQPWAREGRRRTIGHVTRWARKEARRLQRAGKAIAALAVYDALPPELRESAELLPERARLLHALGRLDAAAEMFRSVLATNPTNSEAAKGLGDILKNLGRSDDVRAIVADMVSSKPPTFDVLVQAAEMAKAGNLAALADKLLDQAVSIQSTATPAAIVRAARILLKQGAQGRVIDLLRSQTVRTDPSTRGVAGKLTDQALAQLRLAGWSGASGSVGPTERADVSGAQSILAEYHGLPAARSAQVRRGIAIVIGGLGPNGAQNQTAELVRQICSLPRETVGPVFLLVLSRSRSGPEFYADRLAGVGATIEFLSDFEIDAGESLPADVVARLGFLSPGLFNQTVSLTDRLKAHSPEVILAMSDGIGLIAMLAASLAGTPRVVISARTVPPPERERSDALLKAVYRAAVAHDGIVLVTNASRTAQAFVEWLGKAVRVGVIHNGIDVDRLVSQRDPAATAAHRGMLGIPENARIVGSVFGGRRQKRPRLWIEAAAAIAKRAPDVVFITVGDNLQGDEISAALAEFGLQDRFHRPGIRSDVVTWLDLMDVVLLTSEVEGTPNVLLEAQALGRPVVATDVGGTAETFLPGVTGVLLPADPTPQQVADAVLDVLGDAGFAARAREQGPPFIRQRFDPKRMASEYRAALFGNGGHCDGEPPRETA